MRIRRVIRLVIQIGFFVAAPSLFVAAFNGVKYVFQQLGTGAPLKLTSFLLTLIISLVVTIVCGRVFCGFACAFGTLGDVVYDVVDFLRSKTPLPRLVFPDKLVRVLSWLKYVILAAICVLCFFGVWNVVSGYSPWVSFAAILAGSWEGVSVWAFVTLGVVIILMALRERAFCQFLCPLGALFSLMPVTRLAQYLRVPDRCLPKCCLCRQGCPVSIWPDEGRLEGECIACGRCSATCPISNVHPDVVRLIRKNVSAEDEEPQVRVRLRAKQVPLFAVAPVLVVVLTGAAVITHEPSEVDASAITPREVPSVTDLQTRDLPEEKGGAATLELVMPDAALEGKLKDGTYTGSALCGLGNDEDWAPYYVIVEVSVEGGRVSAVKDIRGDTEGEVDGQYIYDAAENSLYLSRAIKGTGGRFTKGALNQIEAFIESGEAIGGVDTVSGSTYSVVSIVQAYNKAIAEAVAQAKE